MDEFKKCMIVDKMVIFCGVLGFIADIVAIVLGLLETIPFDINYVILLPISIFFIIYGAKQVEKDKKKYHQE